MTSRGPSGCVPSKLEQHGKNGECATKLKQVVKLFNLENHVLNSVVIKQVSYKVYVVVVTTFCRVYYAKGNLLWTRTYNDGLGLCTLFFNLWSNR